MPILPRGRLLALLSATLLPASAAGATCRVDPDSLREQAALIARQQGDATTSYTLLGRTAPLDVHVRVTVDAQGRPIQVDADHYQKVTQRNAMRWRYRCEGDKGGVAEWTLRYPVPHCSLNQTSQNLHPPRYPPAVFRAGIGGEAMLAVRPQGDGQPARQVSVVSSSGNAELDAAAVDAAQRWTFDCSAGVDATEPAQELHIGFAAPERFSPPSDEGKDSEPMEYSTVAEFLEKLPRQADVEPMGRADAASGAMAFSTRAALTDAEPERELRLWFILSSKHPNGPAVVRVRSFRPDPAVNQRRTVLALLCESSLTKCAQLKHDFSETMPK